MIAGPRFSEARVLALAAAYERATEWHSRKPPLATSLRQETAYAFWLRS
jgi:aspartyl-tRNA(Asn)/glutamyl-tRNA(Gln) amidotransferase subunit A